MHQVGAPGNERLWTENESVPPILRELTELHYFGKLFNPESSYLLDRIWSVIERNRV